ncbi:hypothetical protein [Herbaspirillum rubrisubalbicans]|uniref:hypothetical protein n=1 Tax=Herbaspirillum rubrisubalbicans TaxID=80842 RepID=UPI0012E3DE79|nr:hypothetical protein [Herbaspirillum rubrisubalbicans]
MKEVVILLSQESLSAGNGALTRAKTRWSGQAKGGQEKSDVFLRKKRLTTHQWLL